MNLGARTPTSHTESRPRWFSQELWSITLGLVDSTDPLLALTLLVAALVRFLQVTVTFGTGVPCGLFVPSLFVGACLGRGLGIMMAWLGFQVHPGRARQRCAPRPGIYAMVGAAAVLGGVCRVTISLVVIMPLGEHRGHSLIAKGPPRFELTGGRSAALAGARLARPCLGQQASHLWEPGLYLIPPFMLAVLAAKWVSCRTMLLIF